LQVERCGRGTIVAVERSGDTDWYERLYKHFAPARAEAIERGYTEDEINEWIDEAVAAVRSKRRG
jgi:hypothetical protein